VFSDHHRKRLIQRCLLTSLCHSRLQWLHYKTKKILKMSRMKPWAWAGRYDDNAREVIRALSMGKSYRKFKGQHCQLAEQHKPTAPHNTFHNNRLGGGALHHDVIAIWREGNLSCQYWVLLECDWPPLLSLLFFFTPSVIVTMNVCYVHHVVFRSPQSFIQRHLRISLTNVA